MASSGKVENCNQLNAPHPTLPYNGCNTWERPSLGSVARQCNMVDSVEDLIISFKWFTLKQTYIDYYWVYRLLHFSRPPYILHTAPQQRVSPKQDLNGCQSIFDWLLFWRFQGLTWIREEKVDTALTVLWCWRLLSQIKTNVCCATQCSRTTSRTKESDWGSHCWKHLL